MSRTSRALVAVATFLFALASIAASGPFTDLPSPERSLADGLPEALSYSSTTAIHGDASGHVVVLTLQDFSLRALYSTDGGQTFAPEVVIAGNTGQLPVVDFASTLASDGTVAVAIELGDPQGNVGLAAAVSHDRGLSWSAPVTLVKHGDPTMGVYLRHDLLSIAANASGRIAICFPNESSRRYNVSTSSDGGSTWTAPVRIDTAGYGGPSSPVSRVLVDAAGTVHAAYLSYDSSAYVAWHTRSTDGGLTFSTPQNVSQLAHPGSRRTGYWLAMGCAGDGSLVFAIAEAYVSILRSTDGGASFTTSFNGYLNTSVRRIAVASAPGRSTLLVLVQDQSASPGPAGALRALRSTDNGASFGSPTLIAPAARLLWFGATAVGTTAWVIAWVDTGDGVVRIPGAVWARSSLDDGATWATEQRADNHGTAGGYASFARDGVSCAGAGRIALAYTDGSAALYRSLEVRTNSSAVDPVAFGPDRSVPFTRVPANPWVYGSHVATGDGGKVYVAVTAWTGRYMDLYVRTSTDNGQTFTAPVRIADGDPGQYMYYQPRLDAGDGSTLYLTYARSTSGSIGSELYFRRSSDNGATWSDAGPSLGPADLYLGYGNEVQVVRGTSGIYLAWPATTEVYFARSTDGGHTFSRTTLYSGAPYNAYPYSPALCANGDKLVLAWIGYDGWSDFHPYARTSNDGGVTWSDATLLDEGYLAGYFVHVACDGIGAAIAAWPNGGAPEVRRWDGTTWSNAVQLFTPDLYTDDTRPLFVTPDRALVAYSAEELSSDNFVQVAVSNDGGRTFPTTVRLDDPAPQLQGPSSYPRLIKDQGAHVWAFWRDWSAGQPSLVARHSANGGLDWDPLYRVDHSQPQAVKVDAIYDLAPAAAWGGTAYFAYPGQRASFQHDLVYDVYDAGDLDRDGAGRDIDCNDADPLAVAVPAEIAGVRVSALAGGARVVWTGQPAAGAGTVYDVASGLVSSLSGGTPATECLASRLATTSFEDARSAPPAGDAAFELVRARNGCGAGTWGLAALDAGTPCP